MTTEIFETPCRFWLGPVLAVFLSKPEDLQAVLLSPKCLEKPYIYRFMDVNQGLFTAPGWFYMNKILFSNKTVEFFEFFFVQYTYGNRSESY